jgi:hypothetical protein
MFVGAAMVASAAGAAMAATGGVVSPGSSTRISAAA